MNVETLLDKMWNDYIVLNKSAQKIVDLFKEKGNEVVNDHIALRTFNHPRTCVDILAKPFIKFGYFENGTYDFEEKKLKAKHYEHPNKEFPKIFISELLLEEFSSDLQENVNSLIEQVSDETISAFDFTSSGRPWELESSVYHSLKKESDYAAWLSAIGFKPNHFTVFINKLQSFNEVSELNTFLKEKGFELNASGGEVKGSPEVFLEQSSTLADTIEVEFKDKKEVIPSCYFEFAKRYPMSNGELYQGFVAKSADKIFESTTLK